MILYYAIGGGMGHLVRASAFFHTFEIENYLIFTASEYSGKIFNNDRIIRVDQKFEKSPSQLLDFLKSTIRQYSVNRFILDCFSSGILGEISDPSDVLEVPLWYVTRRVRWSKYRDKASRSLQFEKTFVVEEPEEDHRNYIDKQSKEVREIALRYPDSIVPDEINRLLTQKESWIVIHSGPANEQQILINHALEMAEVENRQPQMYITAKIDIPGFRHLDFYPAHALFPYVSRIISGAGFNIMCQAGPYQAKHVAIPFERKYDDQFWRVAEAKKNRSD